MKAQTPTVIKTPQPGLKFVDLCVKDIFMFEGFDSIYIKISADTSMLLATSVENVEIGTVYYNQKEVGRNVIKCKSMKVTVEV